METTFARELFYVLFAALIGGSLVKLVKLQPMVGYILAGVIFGAFLPIERSQIDKLAEIGTILLLFSIGIELSFGRLARTFKVATLGAIIQIIVTSALIWGFLTLVGTSPLTAFVLASGFSLSSTAIVVKILSDRGEAETLHGEIMIGWLLVQDLAVIPLMVIIPHLAQGGVLGGVLVALVKALAVVSGTVILGRLLVPRIVHIIASLNSRELLIISSVAFALGTAIATSLFGISPALGAFLAGVVISETQENHAVFAETRPLRDLFVALFFVTLGFLVTPAFLLSNLFLILGLTVFVILIKFIVVSLLSIVLGYKGRTAIALGLGLSQVGEFSFLLFSLARGFDIISPEASSIGIATTLTTLIITPLLFKSLNPFWRKVRNLPILAGKNATKESYLENQREGHIVLCGFGRVGKWVGKALAEYNLPFVVVEYNHELARDLKKEGIDVIFGDPMESEVLDSANIKKAKVCVLAIPDRVAQEEIIAHIQTVAPDVKIISRAHMDEDWQKLKLLKVEKVIQPEFEAAVAIIKSILSSMGKPKEEVSEKIKNLRLSRAKI